MTIKSKNLWIYTEHSYFILDWCSSPNEQKLFFFSRYQLSQIEDILSFNNENNKIFILENVIFIWEFQKK